MIEFPEQELIEKLARILPTASMGCIVGGSRPEPMYYHVYGDAEGEFSASQLWDALSEEEQDKYRDIAFCSYYYIAKDAYEMGMKMVKVEYEISDS